MNLLLSALILVGSQAADTATTLHDNRPGMYESNPLGERGVLALKWGATTGFLADEYLTRKHPKAARWFSRANLALSVEFVYGAVHNATLK